jgi:hypothetical protein
VPGKQVERAALTVPRVGDLSANLPAESSKRAGDEAHQRRMVLVDQPIDLAAAPPDLDDNERVERAQDRAESSD